MYVIIKFKQITLPKHIHLNSFFGVYALQCIRTSTYRVRDPFRKHEDNFEYIFCKYNNNHWCDNSLLVLASLSNFFILSVYSFVSYFFLPDVQCDTTVLI